jgi:hypothetical protein
LNSRQRSAPRPSTVLFELMDGHYPNPSFICEFLLAPAEKTSGRPTLCRGDHAWKMPKMRNFNNYNKNY